MLTGLQRLTLSLLVTINGMIIGGTAFGVWLLSVWMLADHVAFSLSSAEWTQLAFQRFLFGGGAAMFMGVVLFSLNAIVVRIFDVKHSPLPRYSGLGAAGIVTLAAGIGSVQFAITKPFM